MNQMNQMAQMQRMAQLRGMRGMMDDMMGGMQGGMMGNMSGMAATMGGMGSMGGMGMMGGSMGYPAARGLNPYYNQVTICCYKYSFSIASFSFSSSFYIFVFLLCLCYYQTSSQIGTADSEESDDVTSTAVPDFSYFMDHPEEEVDPSFVTPPASHRRSQRNSSGSKRKRNE
jgi:hypothetical protein